MHLHKIKKSEKVKSIEKNYITLFDKEVSTSQMDTNILVHAYDWKVEEELNSSENSEINCWALTQESKPVLIRVLNFPVSRVWQLPEKENLNWTSSSVNKVIQRIKYMGEHSHKQFKINKGTFINQAKLYYYDKGKRFPFILLEFDNEQSLSICENKLKWPIKVRGLGEFTLLSCESKINSVRKLLTYRDLKTSNWFNVKVIPVPISERISTLGENEYYCLDYKTIIPLKPTDEGYDVISRPGTVSVDLEAHSHRHNAFPGKWNNTDVITMISIVFQKGDHIRKILITQCECNDDLMKKILECKVEIIEVSDEIEIIRKFEEYIRELDPEIITGYNILGFDWDYMNSRLGNVLEKWNSMGRIKSRDSFYDAKSWSSSAYGQNEIKNLIIDGRIVIDMMLHFKRHYKFPKYSLNYVAEQLLGKKKLDVPPKEMFEAKDELDEANKLLKSNEYKEEKDTIELKRKAVGRITKLGAYNIVDSELVLDLFNCVNMWVTSVQFSNAFGIPMSYLSTRGQQIRVYSQLYDECSKMGIIIDMPKQTGLGYKGAFVMEPKPGIFKNSIILDFLSLYPTIIISFNICYSTFVPPELAKLIPKSELHKFNIIEWDQDESNEDKKTKTKKHYKYFFAKSPMGVLPKMLQKLLAERSEVKKALRAESDPAKRAVLDKKQLAIKQSSNSVYGFLGVGIDMATLPLHPAAMTITAMGRMLIDDTNDWIEKNVPNATVVYNDTDSTFVDVGISNLNECVELGKKMGIDVTKFLRKKYLGHFKECNFVGAIELEFENIYAILLCIAKKKYKAIKIDLKTGKLLWDNPVNKGIITARRDNCKWQLKVYNRVIMGLLKGMSRSDVEYIIIREIREIMTRSVDVANLMMNKSIGVYKESSNYFMKHFADRLRRKGKNIQPGDRLDYLVTEDSSLKKVGDRMRLAEEYEEQLKTEDRMWYDREYYVMNVLQQCIEQLYEVGFGKEIKEDIDKMKKSQTDKLQQECKEKFEQVKKQGEDLIAKYLETDRDKINPTIKRVKRSLEKVMENHNKAIRAVPKATVKWGRKNVHTGPNMSLVQNTFRMMMVNKGVISQLESMDGFGTEEFFNHFKDSAVSKKNRSSVNKIARTKRSKEKSVLSRIKRNQRLMRSSEALSPPRVKRQEENLSPLRVKRQEENLSPLRVKREKRPN